MHSSCAGEYISTPPPPACLPAHSTICSAGQHFYASQGPRLRIKWTGRVRLHFTAYVHAMLFKKRPLGFALQRNKELCTSNWHIAFRSHLCLGLRDTLAVDIFFGAQTSSERAEIISSSLLPLPSLCLNIIIFESSGIPMMVLRPLAPPSIYYSGTINLHKVARCPFSHLGFRRMCFAITRKRDLFSFSKISLAEEKICSLDSLCPC